MTEPTGKVISRRTQTKDIRLSSAELREAGLGDELHFEAIPDPKNRRIILVPAMSEKTRWPGVKRIVISGLPEGAEVVTKPTSGVFAHAKVSKTKTKR